MNYKTKKNFVNNFTTSII